MTDITVNIIDEGPQINVDVLGFGPPGKSPYIGDNGTWMQWDGEKWVDTGVVAGGGSGGSYIIGDGLKLEGNKLSVDTVNEAMQDNTKPITSAAVFTTVGNIETILKTI